MIIIISPSLVLPLRLRIIVGFSLTCLAPTRQVTQILLLPLRYSRLLGCLTLGLGFSLRFGPIVVLSGLFHALVRGREVRNLLRPGQKQAG